MTRLLFNWGLRLGLLLLWWPVEWQHSQIRGSMCFISMLVPRSSWLWLQGQGKWHGFLTLWKHSEWSSCHIKNLYTLHWCLVQSLRANLHHYLVGGFTPLINIVPYHPQHLGKSNKMLQTTNRYSYVFLQNWSCETDKMQRESCKNPNLKCTMPFISQNFTASC